MYPRGSSNSPQPSRSNYYSSFSNRNRGNLNFQSSSSSPALGSKRTVNFKPYFIYKGGNKKEWSNLQSKINQKLKHENISYILLDPAEVARRKTLPPPPVIDLPPPMHYLETPQEKEMRAREQANLEKEKKKDFDRGQEKFAVDFAKGMDCHTDF
jgi:hypothetical protein